jgi:hypothetical protein
MPSKGISVYSYISAENVEIEFSVPKNQITNTSSDNFAVKDLEVDSANIPGLNKFIGRFQWRVLENGTEVATAFNDINSFSGKLEGGTMTATAGDVSILKDNLIISYGFYDAGHGVAGLTNKDQFWIAVSPHHSDWMGELAPAGSEAASKPFSRFVLAAPHDSGMNSMLNVDLVLSDTDEDIVKELTPFVHELSWFAGEVRPQV